MNNRVVLITGALTGIGRAAAVASARQTIASKMPPRDRRQP
jgi:NAD(P)-dependent dehydrogenase (short-subunit alcohol dehydrogenase family)